MRGDEKHVVDIDALIMENRYVVAATVTLTLVMTAVLTVMLTPAMTANTDTGSDS